MTLEQIRDRAAMVAQELLTAGSPAATPGDAGSHQRGLPEELRQHFIDVRAALFQRGIYDPVLVRFDTATAPQAPTQQVAEELRRVAESLQS
jgi:hypothetical protein